MIVILLFAGICVFSVYLFITCTKPKIVPDSNELINLESWKSEQNAKYDVLYGPVKTTDVLGEKRSS
jgi:hypothetical protein